MRREVSLALLAGSIAVIGCAAAASTRDEAQALLARDREWAQLVTSSRP